MPDNQDANKDNKDNKNNDSSQSGGAVPDDRIVKYAIIGLASCGLEGGWANFCQSSAGDYPSMGIQGWEGFGGPGDELLQAIGCGQYAGQSYSSLHANGGEEAIKQVLDSEQGHKIQMQLDSSYMANYLGILRGYGWNSSDPKATVFVLMWMGAGPGCCGPYACQTPTANLDEIYQSFLNGWAQKAVASQYWEGYNNRTNTTYQYCQQIDMSKDPDPNMVIDMSGAKGGKGGGKNAASSDGGFEVKGTMVIKLPKNKTFAEPIYPDFITVNDTVPAWVIDAMNGVKGEETKDHAGEIIKDGDAKETAPNGMHYSEADIKDLMDNTKGMTREAAIAQLAKTDKYTRRVTANGDGTFTIVGDDKAPTGTTTKNNGQDKATWVPNDNNNNGSGPKTNTGTSSDDNKNTTGGTDNNAGQQQQSGSSTTAGSDSKSEPGSPESANNSGSDQSGQ